MPMPVGVDREAIMQALFARLSGIALFKSSKRKFVAVSKVTPAEQPLLMLLESAMEMPTYADRSPAKWEIEPTIMIYARTDVDVPGAVLNPIKQAIETALMWAAGDSHPSPGSPTSLGGRVESVRIQGIFNEPGPLDGQAVLVIPLHILVAGAG